MQATCHDWDCQTGNKATVNEFILSTDMGNCGASRQGAGWFPFIVPDVVGLVVFYLPVNPFSVG
ncbi:hypothetical protein DZJ_47760 [Dickeya ananatis]